MTKTRNWLAVASTCAVLLAPALASAEEEHEKPAEGEEGSDSDLQKKVQNPVADLITIPFQNNVGYNIGPFDRSTWILDIEPVVPLHISDNWMIVTRTIIPFIYQPDVDAMGGASSGMGDINPTLFLVPANNTKFIWGVGPTLLFPTATQATTGTGKWGIGPSAVGLIQTKHWTIGALVNNIWSYAGLESRASVNQFLLQYFVNYNLPDAWYLTTSPIITADWKAASGDKWTVPFGGGIGKIIRLGKLPLNAQIQAFSDPIHTDTPPGPTWEIRWQVAFLFPTKHKAESAESSAPDAPPAPARAVTAAAAPARH